MAAIEPRCRQIAIELLEPMIRVGEAELIETFATPFTLRSLCAYLGWPEDQWEALLPAATVDIHGGGQTVGAVRPAELRLSTPD